MLKINTKMSGLDKSYKRNLKYKQVNQLYNLNKFLKYYFNVHFMSIYDYRNISKFLPQKCNYKEQVSL